VLGLVEVRGLNLFHGACVCVDCGGGVLISLVAVAYPTPVVQVAEETYSWTKVNAILMTVSIVGFFVFVLVYSQLQSVSPEYFGVAVAVYSRGVFWLLLILSIGICVMLNFAAEWARREFFPTNIDVTMELERGLGDRAALAHTSSSHQVKSNPSFRVDPGAAPGASSSRRTTPPTVGSNGAVTLTSPLENVHSVRSATAHGRGGAGNPKMGSLEL
jgi:hypothetical protein